MTMEIGTTFTHKTMEEYIEAIKIAHGNMSKASRLLGIDRKSIESKVKHHPELKEIINSYRDDFIDLAEDKLHDCVEKGSIPAIMFTLKTIGKARGWGESQEITINKGQDENEYDLSQLTEEERGQLEQLTAKIYKPRLIEEENSNSEPLRIP